MPDISVIVPVHNAENTIADCILSLKQQTFSDFECLLVVNGCTDNTVHVIEETVGDDHRFYIIKAKKADISYACNLGLSLTTGKYISFVDADDVVSPQFLEILHNTAVKYDSDLTICHLVRFSDGDKPKFTADQNSVEVIEGDSRFDLLLKDKYLGPMRQVKLYKAEVLHSIRYPEDLVHEDEYTAYDTYRNSRRIAVVSAVLYGYRISPGSITTTPITAKRLNDMWRALHCRLLEARHDNRTAVAENTIVKMANDVYYRIKQMDPSERRRSVAKETVRKTIDDIGSSRGLIPLWKRIGYTARLQLCMAVPNSAGRKDGGNAESKKKHL